MNKIKKFITDIKSELIWLKYYVQAMIGSVKNFKKEKIILVGTPLHGNLGDQAITIAELKFLKDYFPNSYHIEISSDFIFRDTWAYRPIVKNHTILIHGGGFIGTLWMNEEMMTRKVINTFKKNKIIIMPQTIYFENTYFGERIKKETKEVYSKHPRIYICTRESKSYEIAKKIFNNQVYLIPDMVTYLKYKYNCKERNGIIFCMRNDKEKKITDKDKKLIRSIVSKYYPNDEIINTDTVVDYSIKPNERINELDKKFTQFSSCKLIITDRLHGMVFAALTGTPCIALSNCNYKVRGIYEWIENNKYIKYVEDLNCFDQHVFELSKINIETCVYNNDNLIGYFKDLSLIISGENQ